MYDYKLKRTFKYAQVRDLIVALLEMPLDARIVCDDDDWFWLHAESDKSVVNIDSAEHEDEYEQEDDYV